MQAFLHALLRENLGQHCMPLPEVDNGNLLVLGSRYCYSRRGSPELPPRNLVPDGEKDAAVYRSFSI